MIKAIFFDLGGVLVHDLFSETDRFLASKLRIPEDAVKQARLKYWRRLKFGRCSCNAFWRGFLAELDAKVSVEQMSEMTYKIMKLMPASIALLKRLSKSGRYKLGIITNNSHEWSEYAKRNLHIRRHFDDWVSSSDVHLAKPRKSMYILAAKRLKVSPSECVFIDNQKKNVDGAIKAGMKAIHFKNARQLEKELKKLGVEF
jgi:putative hydrolase of the HAD superfamily